MTAHKRKIAIGLGLLLGVLLATVVLLGLGVEPGVLWPVFGVVFVTELAIWIRA